MKKNEGLILRGHESKNIIVMDLDDTIIMTDAKIKVINKKTRKIEKELTPAEYNEFQKKSNQVLNFDDFENYKILKKGRATKLMERMKYLYKKNYHISIVTARSNTEMIRMFFLEHGIDLHPELVIAVNDIKFNFSGDTATKKVQAIEKLIEKGYKKFLFFDDNLENLKKVKELELSYDIEINIVKV